MCQGLGALICARSPFLLPLCFYVHCLLLASCFFCSPVHRQMVLCAWLTPSSQHLWLMSWVWQHWNWSIPSSTRQVQSGKFTLGCSSGVRLSFFVVVQSLSCVQLFETPWTASCQAPLSLTISRNLLKFMYVESVMPSNHLFLCHPLLLLPSIFSSIRVFSHESALHIRWPKYWSFSFSFSVSPSNEYSGLISFRIDWFHLFAVPGTIKSLLQRHSLKASMLPCSTFFMVHPSLWPIRTFPNACVQFL